MKPNGPIRGAAWVTTLSFLIGVGLLAYYLPLVAVILIAPIFVGLTLVLAIARGIDEGFWKGLKSFVKDILFDW